MTGKVFSASKSEAIKPPEFGFTSLFYKKKINQNLVMDSLFICSFEGELADVIQQS